MDGSTVKVYMQKGKLRKVTLLLTVKDPSSSKGTVGIAVNEITGVHFDGLQV